MSDRWADLAGAYAVDALEGAEKTAFEERLAVDEELRKLVDEYREAAGAIATAVPDRAPHAALRERVLASARDARAPIVPPADAAATAEPASAPPHLRRAVWAPRGRTSVLPWALLAASVSGVAFFAVANRSLRRDTETLRTEIASLRESVVRSDAERDRLASLWQALTGANIRVASLSGNVDPRLWLIWNPDRRVLVVAATALPQLAADRTYQLWGLGRGGTAVSLGTFNTASDGTAVLALSPDVTADFESSALTNEPAGGSPAPTNAPFLVGPWRAAND
jgi:anti-sigma-K factor RskA